LASAPEPRQRGCAFGLDVESEVPVHGLGAPLDGLPRVRLRLGDEADVARRWRPAEARRVGAGAPDRTIDVHAELGYRLYARYFGLCLVARDGSEVLCAPPPVASWRWQRFLAGRGLPIAALLRGREVLHAGAVAIGGGVVGLVGPSGAGKSSLTIRLVLGGARFFADDVLTIDATDAALLVHPGIAVASLRSGERERLGIGGDAVLGELLGSSGRHRLHYAMEIAAEPEPLRALYFLQPQSGGGAATIRALPAPDPRRLLTSTFVSQVRPPDRLASLLDTCARLAADVPMFEVAMGGDEDSAALAERLWSHLCVAA
jgi:hypothetical protein